MPTNENEQTAYEDTTMQDDVYSENTTSNNESNSDATGGSDDTSGNVSEEEIVNDVHNDDPMPTPPGVEPNGSEPTDAPTTDAPTIEILPNDEFPKDKEPIVGDEPAIKIPDDEIKNPEHGGTMIYPIEFDPERRVVMKPVKQEPVEDNPTTIQPVEDPIPEYYEEVEADMDNKPSDEHKETFVPADDPEVPADDSENSHEDAPTTDDPDASDASGDTGSDSDGTNDSSTGDSDDEKTEETEQPANDESRMHAFFQDIINKAIEHDIDIQGIANKVGIDLAAYGFVIKTKEELLNPTKDAEKTSDEPTDDKTIDTDKESDDPADDKTTDDKTADDVATDTDAGKESDEEKSDQPIETIYTDTHPYPENSVEVVADTLVRNSTDKNDYAGAYSEASTGSENAITDGSNKVAEDYANKVKQNMAYVNRGTATIYQPQVDENGDMLVGEDGNPLYNEVKNEGATVADDSVPSSAKEAYAKQLEIFQSEHTQSMVYTDEELKAMPPEDSAMILAYEDKVKAEYMKETNCIYAEDGSIIDISNVSGSDEILTSLVDDKTSVYENSANTIMADAKSSYEMAQAETTTDTKTAEAGNQEMKADTAELSNKDVANTALNEFNNCMNMAKSGFVNRAALLTDEQQAMVDSIGSETAKDEAVKNMTNERLQKMAEVLGSDYVQMAEDFASGKSHNESEAEADV